MTVNHYVPGSSPGGGVMQEDLIGLFPTPLYVINDFLTESENEYLVEEVHKQEYTEEHYSHKAFVGESVSSHQNGYNFLEQLDTDLGRHIFDKLTNSVNYLAHVMGIGQLDIRMSWSNTQYPGSELIDHQHPNSKVSGSLYVKADDSSSKIYFHNPNPYIPMDDYDYDTDFNNHVYWIQPKSRQLILFPSWLKHGSNGDSNGTEERICIAFNTLQSWHKKL